MSKLLNFLNKPVNTFYQVIFVFWSIELLTLYIMGILNNGISVLFTFICLIVGVIFFTSYKEYAVSASKIALLIFWIFYGCKALGFVLHRLYMFSTKPELFLDSPGIVMAYFVGVFTFILPTLLLVLLFDIKIFTVYKKEKIACWLYVNRIKIERVLNFLIMIFIFLYMLFAIHMIWNDIYVTLSSMLFVFGFSAYFVERVSSYFVSFIFRDFRCGS